MSNRGPQFRSLLVQRRRAPIFKKDRGKKRSADQTNSDRRAQLALETLGQPPAQDQPQFPTIPPGPPPDEPPGPQDPVGAGYQGNRGGFGGTERISVDKFGFGPDPFADVQGAKNDLKGTDWEQTYDTIEKIAPIVIGGTMYGNIASRLLGGQQPFGENALEGLLKLVRRFKDTADYLKLIQELQKRQAAEAASKKTLSIDEALKKLASDLQEIRKTTDLLSGNPPEGLQKPLEPIRAEPKPNVGRPPVTPSAAAAAAGYPGAFGTLGALGGAASVAGSLGNLSAYAAGSIGGLSGLSSLSAANIAAASTAGAAAAAAGLGSGALAKITNAFYDFAGSESDLRQNLDAFLSDIKKLTQGEPTLPSTWNLDTYQPRWQSQPPPTQPESAPTNPTQAEPTTNVWDEFYKKPGYGQPVEPPKPQEPSPPTEPPPTTTPPTTTPPTTAPPDTTPPTTTPPTETPPVPPPVTQPSPTQPTGAPQDYQDIRENQQQPNQPVRSAPQPTRPPPQPRRPTKRL